MTAMLHRARDQILVLMLAVVLGMTPWLSATVAAPAMALEWDMSGELTSWLTLSVQLGFVVGACVSAGLLLSDRLHPQRFAAWSAVAAAAATAALAIPGLPLWGVFALRGVTGGALAGVYPPAIKLAAGWTTVRRGTAIGALVGATTLGSAAPNLLRSLAPEASWRPLVLMAAAAAVVAAALFARVVREGPYQAASAPFNARAVRLVLRNRGVMLATGGYLGHMWELYAMWSTIGLFWTAVLATRSSAPWAAPMLAFATIGAGAFGSLIAGVVADRVGRANVTIVAMSISGACALLIGQLMSAPLVLIVVVATIWGATIVADSAQFSACVTELAPPDYVGTAVTLQTALGFLLTMVTIRLMPRWVDAWGWQWAFTPLALGPVFGIVSMWRLRRLSG